MTAEGISRQPLQSSSSSAAAAAAAVAAAGAEAAWRGLDRVRELRWQTIERWLQLGAAMFCCFGRDAGDELVAGRVRRLGGGDVKTRGSFTTVRTYWLPLVWSSPRLGGAWGQTGRRSAGVSDHARKTCASVFVFVSRLLDMQCCTDRTFIFGSRKRIASQQRKPQTVVPLVIHGAWPLEDLSAFAGVL